MIALDTAFLLDYLDGVDATRSFIEEYDQQPFVAPSLALFEVYCGAARVGGEEPLDRAVTALEWVEPLPLDGPAAREAASIEAELLADGSPVNLGDVLIAGVCRQNGARIATRDNDFDRIRDLEVLAY